MSGAAKRGDGISPRHNEIERRGMDDTGETALFVDREDHQIAQYDDWETGKASGWWKVPLHTFESIE